MKRRKNSPNKEYKLNFYTAIRTLLILLILSESALSAVMFDPQLKWKSIKTDHFYIHFHQGLGKIALRLSEIAEDAHKDLTKDIGWQPALRTDVVLVDNTDMANGFAIPVPYNKIQLYITRPMLNSVLNNYRDWLKLVFVHEYTHILNMDTVSGIPAGSRYILGRTCFPNIFLPIWSIEGNAVFQESKNTIFGRNNSNYTDMILRTEIYSGRFKPISKASVFPREWPLGNVPYLYGGLFIDYLEKKYGTKSMSAFFHENSDNLIPYSDNIYPIPYFFNKDAKDIFNKSFSQLWDEWKVYIKARYMKQVARIKKKPVTEFTIISNRDYNSILPRFGRKGKFIFYIENPTRKRNALYSYNIAMKQTARLCDVNYPNSLSVSLQNDIYISDIELYRSFSAFYDIHKYSYSYRKITAGFRSRFMDIFPDNSKYAVITGANNRYSLIITDKEFKTRNIIINRSGIQLDNVKVSPQGDRLIFSIKDKNGFTDLVIYNNTTKRFTRLTNDSFNDIQAVWHPDGKRIIFSSDRGGIYNLYEIDIAGKKLKRITNLMGGGFWPDISPDGKKIVFSAYMPQGHAVAIMKYPDKFIDRDNLIFSDLTASFFDKKNEDHRTGIAGKTLIEDYNPVFSGLPSSYIPYMFSQEIYKDKYDTAYGLFTYGMDSLMRHIYLIEGNAYAKQKRADINVSYTYTSFYPDISIGYRDNTLFFGEDGFPWEENNKEPLKRELNRLAFAALYFPFKRFNYSQFFQLAYIYKKKYIDIYYPGQTVASYEITYPKVQAVYSFNNTWYYTYSISREDGRNITLAADYYHKKLGAQSEIFRGRAEYYEFLPGLFNNNAFMVRMRGGFSLNNPDYLAVYSLGKFKNGNENEPSVSTNEWGLRGYPAGVKYGNNIATAALEYRFPILQADSAFKTFPLMFRDLWGLLFFEYGDVWDSDPQLKEFKASAGAELHIKITVGYAADISGFAGYAKGFDEGGETQFYLGISSIFKDLPGNLRKRLEYF